MKPTEEQQAALDVFAKGDDLVLEAGAGTGKTSTLRLLGESTQDRGIYVAYNKAIADEAKVKFPRNVQCATAHSFAFRALGYEYKDRLEAPRAKPWDIAKAIGVPSGTQAGGKYFPEHQLVRLALEMVGNFANSADTEITTKHFPFVEALRGVTADGVPFNHHEQMARLLLTPAQRAWDDLQNKEQGVVTFTHDHYLKLWALSNPTLPGDFILFDEAQDANPVIAAVIGAQTEAQRIFVGDRAQAIYGWRGAIDAMAEFGKHAEVRYLSQSFRFGPAIADHANTWLEQLETPLRLTGTDTIDSRLEVSEDPDVVLCRSNAGTVEMVFAEQRRGRRVHLVGGTTDITGFCRGAIDMITKGKSSHRDLLGFNTWDEVRDHAKDEGGSLHTWVKILDRHTPEGVLHALTNCVAETNADVVLSTAHKAKGREWGTVRIAEDFRQPEDKDGNPKPLSAADIMLRYVAVTRAQNVLDLGPLGDGVTSSTDDVLDTVEV